jgi:competence ComEA-like helix-hairpin-helix protein
MTQPSTPAQTVAIRPGRVLAAAAIILGATIATSASVPQAQAAKSATTASPKASPVMTKNVGDLTPEEEEEFSRVAEETIQRVCIECHPFEDIIKTRRMLREWNDQVTVMATKGAPGTDVEFAMIKKYLTRYYGIVRVNTASAEELSSVLGLSSKAAAAAVQYRQTHGPFADLAALSKVEGIDKAKLEEQPEALRFDLPK